MVGGAGSGIRANYTIVPAGTELWHVYPSKYSSWSFNPKSLNRFALPPPPPCSMYYAGDGSACALWEVVLRNLVVEDNQPQYVDPKLVEGRSIAKLALKYDIQVLDLRAPHHRRLSDDPAKQNEWQRLSVVREHDYGLTHVAAKELLAAAPLAAAICWRSRQLSEKTAYVLYDPPLGHKDPKSDPMKMSQVFNEMEVTVLGSSKGWELIDEALAIVGVKRLHGTAYAASVAALMPDDS